MAEAPATCAEKKITFFKTNLNGRGSNNDTETWVNTKNRLINIYVYAFE